MTRARLPAGGFTLWECLLVLIISGLALGLLFPVLTHFTEKGNSILWKNRELRRVADLESSLHRDLIPASRLESEPGRLRIIQADGNQIFYEMNKGILWRIEDGTRMEIAILGSDAFNIELPGPDRLEIVWRRKETNWIIREDISLIARSLERSGK